MATGYKGGGTMKYKNVTSVKNKKDIIPGVTQRAPMANPTKGRVLDVGTGRKGVQETS